MTISLLATVLYGALVLWGGVMGYVKAKSKPSLIAGVVSGLSLMIGAIVQGQGIAWGLSLAQFFIVLLVVVFTLRLIKTRQFMPAGLMLVMGLATLGTMVIR